MIFHDDESKICDVCGEEISAGETYYEYKSWICCSEDCVKDKLYELNAKDISEEYIMTAEDHEADYGDRKFEEEREERLNEHN